MMFVILIQNMFMTFYVRFRFQFSSTNGVFDSENDRLLRNIAGIVFLAVCSFPFS